MLTTLELRWFAHGTLPTEVKHWFSADCPGDLLGSPEEREDLYLYIPDCDYLNIKLRQGNLEVKWRKAELGILQVGDDWEGKVEKWLKWSCEDPTQQSMMPAEVVSKGPWVSVMKERCQRRYSSRTPSGNAERPSQRQYQGISYELTQLKVKNDAWWSIAFEMAVEDDNPIDRLEDIVQQVNKTYRGPELLAKNSYAYPNWLSFII
jgi:hypothetical protein